jgi:hypothetical protein
LGKQADKKANVSGCQYSIKGVLGKNRRIVGDYFTTELTTMLVVLVKAWVPGFAPFI